MSKVIQFVGFKVYNEFFGVPIERVKEIVRVPEITPVPETPDFVEGVINLRGKIIPVVDMRKRLRLPSEKYDRVTRILILELDGKIVGLIVDMASQILRISENAIEPPPEIISSIGADYITAVGKLEDKLVVMIDLAKLLSPEEMRKVEIFHKRIETKGAASLNEGKTNPLEEGTGA